MTRLFKRMGNHALATMKWMLLCGALLIVLLGAFVLGWKSRTSEKEILKGDAVDRGPRVPTIIGTSNSESDKAETEGPERLLSTAIGTLRFGGRMGEAEAFQMVEDLEKADLPNAFATAIGLPPTPSRDRLIDFLLDRWARIDPPSAFAACADAFGSDRESFLARARMPLLYLGREDPASAFAAWRKHYAPLDEAYDDSTEFQLSGIFTNWARKDFETAFQEYLNLGGENAKYALRGLFDHGNLDQRVRVLTLLEESGEVDALAEGRKTLVKRLARSGDHEQAIAWLDQQNLDAQIRAPLEEGIAEGWFPQAPGEAAAWLLSRSDDSNRGKRLAEITRDWADWEANAAGAWLGRMVEEYGPQSDKAIGRFAESIATKDPSTALEWLATITNDAERQKAAQLIGRRLSMTMMDGVDLLLTDSPLGEEDRAIVLEASQPFHR